MFVITRYLEGKDKAWSAAKQAWVEFDPHARYLSLAIAYYETYAEADSVADQIEQSEGHRPQIVNLSTK